MRPILSFLCLLSVAIVISACGGDQQADAGATAADDKSITIWWAEWAPSVGLQELGNEFEKESGIKVSVKQIPWPSFQKDVFLEFSKKQTDFDVVVGDSQWIGRGATDGLYLELTDWLPGAVDLKTIHPQALKYLCEYPAGSAKYFAAPCETDAVGFSYRKDWFADEKEQAAFKTKYGRDLAVPNTWAEFKDIAEFFNRPDEKRFGCALLTGRGYDSLAMGFQQVMWAFGGSWGDAQTFKVAGHLDSAASVEALSFFKSLLAFAPNGASNFDYMKCLSNFQNGSVAMAMNYFAFYPGIQAEMGDKAGFFKMPAKGDKRVISLGGQGFSISKKTTAAKQDLAKEFIAWFLQKSVQEQWIQKPAGFTAHTEVLASDAFRSATPYNKPFAESLDHLQDFWNAPVYNELLASAVKKLGEALDGSISEQEALSAIATEHEEIFKDAGLLK